MVFENIYEKSWMRRDQCSKPVDSSTEKRTGDRAGIFILCRTSLDALSTGSSGLWNEWTDADVWDKSLF